MYHEIVVVSLESLVVGVMTFFRFYGRVVVRWEGYGEMGGLW